jgi:hypothetical protein
MSIVRQPAYIAKSPISVAIGGTVPAPFPPTPVIPAQDLQINGVLTGTGRGKWVSTIDYYAGQFAGPTTFTFSDLEGVTANFFTGVPNTTTSISAPNLIYVGNNIGISGSASLVTLDIPKVQMVVGQIFSGISSFTGLTTINVQSLRAFSQIGNANIFNVLTTLDLTNVQYIFTGIGSVTFSVLTSLNLSSLIYVGSNGFSFSAPLMTTLTMPTLGTWKAMLGNVGLSSIALNQTSVDNLLAALAYMDGNNGTVLFGTGKIVSITGTSSTPSAVSTVNTAGANFSATGATCIVNMTAHGYNTGDVLQLKNTGVANFNRYASITRNSADQFQYAISSTTATGSGTATVVRAGTSAAALVTRGVTLTTN